MKEFIQQERARLQEVFRELSERGAWMVLLDGAGKVDIRLGLVDSFIVTRVAPKFDAAGNHTGTDFWLLWKAVGYDEGARHSHTVKVVRWWQDDVYMIDFVDTYDRHHHAEFPLEQTEPNEVRDLKKWHDYKKANAARFAEIDAGVLEEHIRLAEEWT